MFAALTILAKKKAQSATKHVETASSSGGNIEETEDSVAGDGAITSANAGKTRRTYNVHGPIARLDVTKIALLVDVYCGRISVHDACGSDEGFKALLNVRFW